MRTICFVILNYKTWREAAACAESILKTQQGQDIRIVLVDNGSGNGSEESLREEFAGEEKPWMCTRQQSRHPVCKVSF